MQAACGLAQLQKLPQFIQARKDNFQYLHKALVPLQEFLVLPEATNGADPSWFGFPITLKEDAPVTRLDLLTYLDQEKIGTRLLFAGNLTRQPSLQDQTYRVASTLSNTDTVMQNTFWVGVQPALSRELLDYSIGRISRFLGEGVHWS